MYSKESTEKLNSSTKVGTIVLIIRPPSKAPENALVASCDGCGAQIWIPRIKVQLDDPEVEEIAYIELENNNHRTYCPQCLRNLG